MKNKTTTTKQLTFKAKNVGNNISMAFTQLRIIRNHIFSIFGINKVLLYIKERKYLFFVYRIVMRIIKYGFLIKALLWIIQYSNSGLYGYIVAFFSAIYIIIRDDFMSYFNKIFNSEIFNKFLERFNNISNPTEGGVNEPSVKTPNKPSDDVWVKEINRLNKDKPRLENILASYDAKAVKDESRIMTEINRLRDLYNNSSMLPNYNTNNSWLNWWDNNKLSLLIYASVFVITGTFFYYYWGNIKELLFTTFILNPLLALYNTFIYTPAEFLYNNLITTPYEYVSNKIGSFFDLFRRGGGDAGGLGGNTTGLGGAGDPSTVSSPSIQLNDITTQVWMGERDPSPVLERRPGRVEDLRDMTFSDTGSDTDSRIRRAQDHYFGPSPENSSSDTDSQSTTGSHDGYNSEASDATEVPRPPRTFRGNPLEIDTSAAQASSSIEPYPYPEDSLAGVASEGAPLAALRTPLPGEGVEQWGGVQSPPRVDSPSPDWVDSNLDSYQGNASASSSSSSDEDIVTPHTPDWAKGDPNSTID